MNKLSLLAYGAATIAASLFACGDLSDPTKGGSERVATVTGALTGTSVPDGTRVALVWRRGVAGGVEVGADVAVVGGRFAMDLAEPPSGYFFPLEASDYVALNGEGRSTGASAPTTANGEAALDMPAPAPPGEGAATKTKSVVLRPQDSVSGQITQPMNVAVAGFVVYVDANGNGRLDLDGPEPSSSDRILGGNDELLLTFLKDGGALDYEKLRDRSGILPARGYNLAWGQGRWLPLDLVELKLSEGERLPPSVCTSTGGIAEPPSVVTFDAGAAPTDPTVGRYPPPDAPNLHCAPDGRSFQYLPPSDCTPPEPPRSGLCTPEAWDLPLVGCSGGGYGEALAAGEPPPPGWPCTVDDLPIDGGAAPDGG